MHQESSAVASAVLDHLRLPTETSFPDSLKSSYVVCSNSFRSTNPLHASLLAPMKRQNNAKGRAIGLAAANLDFSTQLGHIFPAFKDPDTHTRRFSGLEGFEKFFPDELIAHPTSCIPYFNDCKIILPFQSNPNFTVAAGGLNGILDEMSHHPLKTG